jgi:hypothetical protein
MGHGVLSCYSDRLFLKAAGSPSHIADGGAISKSEIGLSAACPSA